MKVNPFQNTAAVILAAGEGTRIRSVIGEDKNKVTLTVGDRPLVSYIIENLSNLGVNQVTVVVGYNKDSVISAIGNQYPVTFAEQGQRLGTGHAVECALPVLKSDTKYVLVVNGDDSALLPPEILRELVDQCQNKTCAFSMLTAKKENPFGLGRIIRKNDRVIAIVEEKNATQDQRLITEINTGVYCFKSEWLTAHINEINPNPVNQERYITDLVALAVKHGDSIATVSLSGEFFQGVNTPGDLERLQARFLK